ncbi:MAG: hypothetical protein AB2A00_05570 [Myxococcota bacterium]
MRVRGALVPLVLVVPLLQAQESAPASEGYPVHDEAAAVAWVDARLGYGKYDEIYHAVKGHAEAEERPELQWRVARALIGYFEVHRETPDAEKLKAYTQAEELVRKCVARAGQTVPHCYLYLGIALGRQGTVRGIMKSVRLAKEVEQSWLTGLNITRGKPFKLDEDLLEAHFHYVLGIFYRIVPDWWIVKVVAGTRGDKKKSIEFHRQSVRLRPDTSTFTELGVSLICHGQKKDAPDDAAEGLRTLEKVLTMPEKSAIDAIDKRNCRLVLANPKLACGYSRDKFQEIDDKPPR